MGGGVKIIKTLDDWMRGLAQRHRFDQFFAFGSVGATAIGDGAFLAGMTTRFPQARHFTSLPRAASGTESIERQSRFGQISRTIPLAMTSIPR